MRKKWSYYQKGTSHRSKHLVAKNPNLALRTIKRAPTAGRSYIMKGETSPEPIIIKLIHPGVEDEAATEVVDENPILGRRTNP